MKLNGSKPKNYVFVPVGVLIIFVLLNRSVVKVPITVHPPEKTVTPYEGRLTLIMPGHTHMVVHLKDKNKMRHRKRWSQVCERTCINKYAYFISDICFEWLLMASCESYRLWSLSVVVLVVVQFYIFIIFRTRTSEFFSFLNKCIDMLEIF